jgi:hypothetical protein
MLIYSEDLSNKTAEMKQRGDALPPVRFDLTGEGQWDCLVELDKYEIHVTYGSNGCARIRLTAPIHEPTQT